MRKVNMIGATRFDELLVLRAQGAIALAGGFVPVDTLAMDTDMQGTLDLLGYHPTLRKSLDRNTPHIMPNISPSDHISMASSPLLVPVRR